MGSCICAFDWYQNYRPWATTDLERPMCSLLQKRCVFWSPLQKFKWRQTPTITGKNVWRWLPNLEI